MQLTDERVDERLAHIKAPPENGFDVGQLVGHVLNNT